MYKIISRYLIPAFIVMFVMGKVTLNGDDNDAVLDSNNQNQTRPGNNSQSRDSLVDKEPTTVHFRIATGAPSGTYFPIGGTIANLISRPIGSPPCPDGVPCGIEGMIAKAIASSGSIENIQLMRENIVQSALVQSDVVHAAYYGLMQKNMTSTEDDKDPGPFHQLRVMASLYPEAIHIVVHADADIKTINDLVHKRISIGKPKSGTRLHASMILGAYGLSSKSFEGLDVSSAKAGEMLTKKQIDAMFVTAGAPVALIEQLAHHYDIRLLPIYGRVAQKLVDKHPYLSFTTIESDAYNGILATPTLSTKAQWVVRDDVSDDLVYAMVRELWHEGNIDKLQSAHRMGQNINIETALFALSIPLHPGALRFYREQGLFK